MGKIYISASKINTYLGCDFAGWVQYNLGIRGSSTEATSKGSIVHYVCEALVNPRHRGKIQTILETRNVFSVPSVERMIHTWARKFGILDKDSLNDINEFLLVALSNDFLCEGSDKILIEYPFNYEGENFIIRGFIDKLAFFEKEKLIIVYDYKTSKSKIKKDENLQGKIYEFVIKKQFPGYKVKTVFLYLRFKRSAYEEYPESDKEELEMFEEYLVHFSDYLISLDRTKIGGNLAFNNPDTRRKFCGSYLPGQLTESGKKGYCCEWKFPRKYYSLLEKGRVIQNSLDKSELERIRKRGQKIVEKMTEGCPAYRNLWENNSNEKNSSS